MKALLLTICLCILLTVVLHCQTTPNEDALKEIFSRTKSFRHTTTQGIRDDRSGTFDVINLNRAEHLWEAIHPQPHLSDSAAKCTVAAQVTIDDEVVDLGCEVTLDDLRNTSRTSTLLTGPCLEYARFAIRRKRWECNSYRRAYAITTPILANHKLSIVGMVADRSNRLNFKVDTSLLVAFTADTLKTIRVVNDSMGRNLYDYLIAAIEEQDRWLKNRALVNDLSRNVGANKRGGQPSFALREPDVRALNECVNPAPKMWEAAAQCESLKRARIDVLIDSLGCACDIPSMIDLDSEVADLLLHASRDCIEYAKFAVAMKQWECNSIRGAVVITGKDDLNRTGNIILLVTSGKKAIKATDLKYPRDIYSSRLLRTMAPPAGSMYTNLYDHLNDLAVKQNAQRHHGNTTR